MPSLIAPISETPLVFVDVETTGASTEYGDRVIEVALAKFQGGELKASFSSLIDPQRMIGPGITALTGITSEMCEGQPLFPAVIPTLLEQMQGAVIVGHNVPFDLGFLRNEFRLNQQHLPSLLPGGIAVDTVRIARKLFGRGGNGLQSLAGRFGVADTTAHRAMADVLTTARVFYKLLEIAGFGPGASLVDLIQLQGGVVKLDGVPKANALPLELQEALDQRVPVQMEYVDAQESRSIRIITPLEVRKFRNELVLLAFCAMRQDRRTFKLERIVRLTKIDPDSQVPPSGEATGVGAGED